MNWFACATHINAEKKKKNSLPWIYRDQVNSLVLFFSFFFRLLFNNSQWIKCKCMKKKKMLHFSYAQIDSTLFFTFYRETNENQNQKKEKKLNRIWKPKEKQKSTSNNWQQTQVLNFKQNTISITIAAYFSVVAGECAMQVAYICMMLIMVHALLFQSKNVFFFFFLFFATNLLIEMLVCWRFVDRMYAFNGKWRWMLEIWICCFAGFYFFITSFQFTSPIQPTNRSEEEENKNEKNTKRIFFLPWN